VVTLPGAVSLEAINPEVIDPEAIDQLSRPKLDQTRGKRRLLATGLFVYCKSGLAVPAPLDGNSHPAELPCDSIELRK
jgi:hypothetical protein